ncbi:MAG: acylphosphatase [Saprospiraceae bacterium]
MSIKCRRIEVYGKVQGVWYRASTKRKAEELGLSGTVENKTDGSVYIEVSGSEDQINSLIDWCKEGPELAEVRRVNIESIEQKSFTGFTVLR